jgi:DNA ligase (NAD+)
VSDSGSGSTAAERVAELRAEIREHDHAYYVLDDARIPDDTYDELLDELRRLEQEHPELATPESPTQRVGGTPLEKFEQYEHAEPMLSLANARDAEELEAWVQRIRNLLKRFDITVEQLAYEPSRRSTGWRFRSPTRTASSCAAPPGATGGSVRT